MMKRILSVIAITAVLVSTFAFPVFAADGDTGDITAIMQTGLDSAKADVLSIISVALPIGLGIFALFFGVRKGIAMLRGVAK